MHHAFIIVGESSAAQKYLLETWSITTLPKLVTSFGIDESRELKAEQSRKTADGQKRHLVVACETITAEAQQALLKTFEEPTPGVHLFLVVPERNNLLPTLLSRCELIELGGLGNGGQLNASDAEKFIAASLEDRLAGISEMLKKFEDPASLHRVSQELVRRIAIQLRAQKSWAKLYQTEKALKRLSSRATMPRLALEHLAMVI